jgi:hypothetical protein
MASFSATSNQAYLEFRVGMNRHTCFSYVAKSKSDQDVQVCGIFMMIFSV